MAFRTIEEYQGKGVLKHMLKEIDFDNKEIYLTIHINNKKSQEVFKHIGFILLEDNLYKISKILEVPIENFFIDR